MKKQSEQKRQIKLARKAYRVLTYDGGIGGYVRQILNLEMVRERKHRSFSEHFGESHPHAASTKVCAEQSVVHNIARFILMERVRWPQGRDLLSAPHSILMACGMADAHGNRVRAIWTEAGVRIEDVAALDYIVLVSPEKKEAL